MSYIEIQSTFSHLSPNSSMVRASHRRSEGCGFESRLGTQLEEHHHNNIYVRASIHLLTLITCRFCYGKRCLFLLTSWSPGRDHINEHSFVKAFSKLCGQQKFTTCTNCASVCLFKYSTCTM